MQTRLKFLATLLLVLLMVHFETSEHPVKLLRRLGESTLFKKINEDICSKSSDNQRQYHHHHTSSQSSNRPSHHQPHPSHQKPMSHPMETVDHNNSNNDDEYQQQQQHGSRPTTKPDLEEEELNSPSGPGLFSSAARYVKVDKMFRGVNLFLDVRDFLQTYLD